MKDEKSQSTFLIKKKSLVGQENKGHLKTTLRHITYTPKSNYITVAGEILQKAAIIPSNNPLAFHPPLPFNVVGYFKAFCWITNYPGELYNVVICVRVIEKMLYTWLMDYALTEAIFFLEYLPWGPFYSLTLLCYTLPSLLGILRSINR